MEPSSVEVEQSLFSLSVSNFIGAYLALARAVERSTVVEAHQCIIVRSPVPHALGNFAICSSLDRTSAFEVWRASQDASVFQVYVPAEHECEQELLLQRGFEFQQSLELMVLREPITSPSVPLSILEIDSHGRHSAADFMTRIFFKHQNGADRERTTKVISMASMPMYCAWHPLDVKTYRTIVGAMSVNLQDDSIGIYNLCVDGTQQRRGIGASMLAKFAQCNFVNGRPIVLQCNPNLLPFYQRLGFDSVGRVVIFHKKV
ncbi:MAG TPA: GNAT family N-acetyltransferase [Fimbriimonadaceae bacterium]|nr:GNAT family N-acetyltransferase [Fimbriimonadaceae bacterium]